MTNDLALYHPGMNKVQPKTGAGPSDAEVKAMAANYGNGDLKAIEAKMKLKFKAGAKFKDANDFAKQMLAGTCLAD